METDLIFILVNIFGTYVVYKFMLCFFEERCTSKKIEVLSYVLYTTALILVYFFLNFPLAFLVMNVFGIFLLTYNYCGSLKTRILSSVYIYTTLLCIECLYGMLYEKSGLALFEQNNYTFAWGVVGTKVISYVVVVFIGNLKNLRNGGVIPLLYWVCLFFMPLSSLYIMLVLFNTTGLAIIHLICSVIILILLNFMAFQLYDTLVATFEEKLEKTRLEEQGKYYDNQLHIMDTSLKSVKMLKHDLKNHFITLNAFIENAEIEKAQEYLQVIQKTCGGGVSQSETGNLVVDSVLNFKINEANQHKVTVNLDISVPSDWKFESFDMTCLLGNLLDNAIEAASEVLNGEINLRIRYKTGQLFIQIENSFDSNLWKGIESTTKKDKKNHGIGLNSIRSVIEKYSGTLDVYNTKEIFTIAVLIFEKV